ncbi:MAG: hypothetical protein R2778_03160 [Saprospiraceae bacterium]
MASHLPNPAYVYVVESSGGKFGAFTNQPTAETVDKLQDGADINYLGTAILVMMTKDRHRGIWT